MKKTKDANIPFSCVELKAEAEHWCPFGEESLVRHCVHDKEACRDCDTYKRKIKDFQTTYAIELKLPKDIVLPDVESGTQAKIREITDAMKDLLLYKNEKYGDSAINPKKIFYKGDSTNSILIRLDDKLGRVTSNTEEKPRVNDVCDIIGYCTLLLISMGVTKEDIEKFKD